MNIMSTIDVALDLADSEASPIQPSMPVLESIRPEALTSAPPPSAGARASRRAVGIWAVIGVASVVLGIAIRGRRRRRALAKTSSPRPRPRLWPFLASARNRACRRRSGTSRARPRHPLFRRALPLPSSTKSLQAKLPAVVAVETDTSGEQTVNTPTCVAPRRGRAWASCSGGDQPGRAISEMGLGRRALMLGKLDDAQLSFCRAAVLDPTRPEAFQALVRVLLLRRDATQAREWAERAAKQHPESQEVQSLFGDALARAGDVDRARSIWLDGAKIDPSDAASVRGMAYTYVHGAERAVKGADYAQADRLYRRAVLLDPLERDRRSGSRSRSPRAERDRRCAPLGEARAVSLELQRSRSSTSCSATSKKKPGRSGRCRQAPMWKVGVRHLIRTTSRPRARMLRAASQANRAEPGSSASVHGVRARTSVRC